MPAASTPKIGRGIDSAREKIAFYVKALPSRTSLKVNGNRWLLGLPCVAWYFIWIRFFSEYIIQKGGKTMQKQLRKLLSLVLVLAMVVGYIPAVLNASAASATQDTEAASDMLASASFVSGNVSWNGNSSYTYDNKSTVTNGADSLYSWRFSRTTAEGYTYPDMRIDLGKSYDLSNQNLVFDIKADPAEELTAYTVSIALYDSASQKISEGYSLYYAGEGWHTVTLENSAMQAYLVSGKSLSDVKYINIHFTLPAGGPQNIYIDNMRLSQRPAATDAMDSAADMLADAKVVSNVANNTTLFYEHDCTAVSYGANSNTSHKFSAVAGEDETLTVKYDLGKSYDLTNKDLVLDMLSYNAGNGFLINLYNSSNKLVSYTSSYTTRGQWASVTPAILNGLQPGMNLSDVRYISIGVRFNSYTSVADRTFYVDNMRLADIDVHYTPLQNKNIVFFGDSITAAVGYKGWSGELKEHYGINHYNLGVGGTSYSDVEERTPIYNQLKGIPTDVDVDFFVLNGGVNDIWSAIDDLGTVSSIPVSSAKVEDFNFETTASGMEKVFCYLRTNYPDAQIAFVLNYICYTGDFDGVRFRDEFVPLAKAICDKWGVPYLDLANDVEFNSKFSAVYGVHTYDGVHGNDHGFELVMREIAPWLISMCEGTEQTEQDTDRLAYATVSSSKGDFTYSSTCTDTYGSESIRSWKFSAGASQSETASALLYLQSLNSINLTGKALELDVKFEGGAQKLGIQFYDANWKAMTDTVWAEGNGASGWQTITLDAAVFEAALKSGMSLNGVNFLNFTFDFTDNAQSVYIDNLRIVNDKATDATEAASDLLYGASYVEGYFGTPGFGYDMQNTSYVNGTDSKYSLRFFAADDSTAWTTATFKLPQTIDLTKNALKFDVIQRNNKAVSVALYDSNYKQVASDDFSLKDTGWQTFEVNALFGLASGRTSADLADIAYIKFSFSFETASVGRTIIIDNLSIYENEQYATMISGMNGLYLGDSISEAISYKGWAGELAEHYGVTGVNVSASGAVVINNKTHNLHQQLNRVPDGADFDFVLLNGGVNDVWKGHPLGEVSPEGTTEFNVDTTIGALEDLFSRLKAAYPNSEICYILNYVCVQAGYPSDNFRDVFAPLAREACAKWGIHCLDLVDNDAFNAEFDASAGVHTYDGVHPNTEGYVVLTKYIATWLEEVMCVDAKVRYQQLSLSDDLTMRFDLLVSDTYKETATVTVTVGGEVVADNVLFSTLADGTTGCKRVEVALAAAQMMDDIVITISNDGTVLFEETYSVKAYAQYLLDGDYGSKTENLANAVLNYGANAQLFFGYNTDNLANAGLTAPEAVEIPEVNTENMVSGGIDGVIFNGASLVFVSKVAVRFYFYVDSNISEYTFSTGAAPVYKDGRYYVEVSGINPQDYGKDIVLTVTKGGQEMTITYSPMAYISRMYGKTTDESLKNLLMAMYQYHRAAVAYVAEDVVRGDYFAAGESATIDVVNTDKLASFSFDYKLVEGNTIAVALCSDWSNYYGYYTFNAKGANKTYEGVTTSRLDDGYVRVTFDIAALTDLGNTPNGIIDFVYVRGGWSDAAGYLDAITFTVDDGAGDEGGNEGGDEGEDRGEAFTAGVDLNVMLDNTDVLDKLSIDYKITSGEQFHLALMEDWSNFYSYYVFTANGPKEAYTGVTYETLKDGYIRVTFDIAALDKINGNPTGAIQFLYIRGNWSDASGFIGLANGNDDTQDPVPDVGGTVFEGGSFTAGTDLIVSMDNQNAVTSMSFDYQITSGGTFALALLPDWDGYFGYFNFNANGAVNTYNGVTTEKLSNGYIRVYVDLTAVTNIVNTPSDVLTILYIRGGWSDANGTLTNICLNSNVQQPPRGENFTGGVSKTIEFGNGQALSTVSFEYKIVSGNQIALVLMPDWENFYGYFELNAEGSNAYDGVSYEMLDDGYVRVTFNMAALTKMSGTPTTAIAFMYIRDIWTDASGYIDNIRYVVYGESGEPEPSEPEVTEPEVTEPEETEPSAPDITGRGTRFLAGEGLNMDLGAGSFSTVTMEYRITNKGTFYMVVCSSWSDFFGYYGFNENGTVENYAGITCEKLSDGYIRVTFEIAELNMTAGAPTQFLRFMYISGGQNTADGFVDKVSVVDYREEVIRGEAFASGANWSATTTEANYGAVTFDYKITNDGTIAVALLDEGWNTYYGYYTFDKNGPTGNYEGVTSLVRSDGYVYVTFDVAALTKTSSAGTPAAIGAIRIRGSASTATGYVDNVQFKESVNPTGIRFGVLSDVHVGNDDTQWASNHLRNALTSYKLQGVDAIVITGDLQNHYKEPYTVEDCKAWIENLADVWFEVFPGGINDLTGEPVEPILIYGNHDQLLVAEEYWPSRFGEYTDAYLKEVNGYYFVGAMYQREYAAAQLLDYAEENSNGYPFFYMQHCPMIDILYGEDLNATDFQTGMTMRDDLWNVSNAITFSGHTHLPATDERSIYQPSDADDAQFTAIQVPSLNYARLIDLGYTIAGDASASKQGLYVVVEGSVVSVSRLSFADKNYPTGEKLGADWVFDAADPNDKPYGYETRANQVKPEFAEDAEISIVANSGDAISFSFPAATVTVPEGFSDQIQSYYVEIVNVATGKTVFAQDFVTNYFLDAKPENFAGPYTVTANGLQENTTYQIRVYAKEFYQVSSEPLTMEITTAEAVIRGQKIVAGESYSINTNISEPITSISFEYKIISGEKFNIAALPDWNNFFGYVACYASGYLGSDPGVSYQVLPDGYIRVTMDLTKMTTMHGTPTNVIELLYIRGSWSDANGYIDNIQYVTGEELPEVTEPEVTEPEATEPEVTEPVIRGKAFSAGANSYFYTECTDDMSQFSFEYKITNDGRMDVLIGNDNGQYGNFYFGANGAITSLDDTTAKSYPGVTTEALNDGYIRVTLQLDELTTVYRGTPGLVISYIRVRATTTASGYVDNVRWDSAQTDVIRGQEFKAGSSLRVHFETGIYNTVSFDYKFTSADGVMQFAILDSTGNAYYGRFKVNATGEEGDNNGVEVKALSDGYYRVTITIAEVTDIAGTPADQTTLYIRGSGTTASGYVDVDASNFT